MKKSFNTKDMAITALLIAFGIIIPTMFSGLRVYIPPFSATLTAHVPVFVAMFISPMSAIFTSLGTTVGFIFAGLDPAVTARAFSHIIFAIVGAFMFKKGISIVLTGVVTMVLHAIFEALVSLLFLSAGWSASNGNMFYIAFYVTGIGTLVHHIIDYIIAVVLVSALSKTKAIKSLPRLF
ncbi:MAG: ECF transporter S component [Clostridia bacterium]|nr:ECF transporter S component [Clostridia bacterium]